MDYSLPNDPDLPAGTSPWQSSPQHLRRNDSMSESGSVPSSPLAKHSPYRSESQQQGHGAFIDPERLAGNNGGFGSDRVGELSGPGQNASAQNTSGGDQSSPAAEQDSHGRRRQQQQQPMPPQLDRQPQAQQQQRAAGPNRYHSSARPTARQALPQYKLQAKVTGLERTGRKDPAVRFDVHVSSMTVQVFVKR